ncbi:A24 family peptidase [Castellaniella sp.]|uniref:A24 family peptidase n=1 Tax=Castellaniella sp. TaxID=1955812 RepID=UPI003C77D918
MGFVGVTGWLLLFCGLNAGIIRSDLRQRRVPNRLLLLAFCLQAIWLLGCAWFAPGALPWMQDAIATQWAPALMGAGVALVVLFPLWRFRAMGAGDVKFAACLGFCLGLTGLVPAFLLACVMAGIHALAYCLCRMNTAALQRFGIFSVPRSTPFAAYMAMAVLFGLGWQALHGRPWLAGLVGRS